MAYNAPGPEGPTNLGRRRFMGGLAATVSTLALGSPISALAGEDIQYTARVFYERDWHGHTRPIAVVFDPAGQQSKIYNAAGFSVETAEGTLDELLDRYAVQLSELKRLKLGEAHFPNSTIYTAEEMLIGGYVTVTGGIILPKELSINKPQEKGGDDQQPTTAPAQQRDDGCFTSETNVAMSDGSFKEISSLKIGDKVESFDFKKDRKVSSKVTALFTFDKKSFLHLNNLKVTEKHPFAVGIDKWKEAGELKIGDQVIGNNKITIKNIKRVNKPVSVFNITVNGTHNYYVDDRENTFLVHNKGIGGGCFIKESKVLMADKSTKNIEKIKIGDKVLGFNLKTKKWGKYPVTEKQCVKGKKGYFVLNKKLKVSPVHQIYVNRDKKTAPEIKLNDTILNGHKKTRVTSIEYVDKKADRHNIVLGRNKDVLFMVNDVFVFNGW